MKKTYRYLMLALAGTVILSGCGKKDDDTSEKETETSASTEAAVETETETETEDRTLQPITPSDYLVENASDYVTLGSYNDIEIVQYTYDITDDMVQEQIDAALQDAATEEETTDPSATGDIVYVSLKSSVQGVENSDEEEDTYFVIGEADYGEDFDAGLIGVSAGDEKKFSVKFDDDFWIDTWAGNTVDFDASVTQVTQLLVPEYDDDFLATYTDYTTKEDYEASIRAALEDEYTQTSYSDAIDELFQAAEDATAFNGYPQELYDSCKEEVLAAYTVFAGDDDTSVEDVLSAFGITDEDIDSETLDEVNHRLLISAYCEQNKIEVTEDEYVSFVTDNAAYYGAADAVELEDMYTRDALVWNLYESKMAEQLYQNAKVTETPYTEGELFSEEDFTLDETEALSENADAADDTTEAASDISGTDEATTEAASEAETTA